MFYPNDRRSAHVHLTGNGCEAVFNLHWPDGAPELRENYGLSAQELGGIKVALAGIWPTCVVNGGRFMDIRKEELRFRRRPATSNRLTNIPPAR